eukprot:TRINITY_DN3435_c0_g1_i1.p1 TRINITY_DN3435_c0_g1~~TRINITY_DN3435_c0_g1_i1.p1  ORF type:complete len:476 (+),score=97.49 TRINITY_DN3435_c0_g1_i1:2-1429(+)
MALTTTLFLSILGAVLGMFYFGFNTGVINAPQDSIEAFINKSHQVHYDVVLEKSTIGTIFSIIVAMFVVGGMVGAMSGGLIAEKIGRKRGLILCGTVGLIGGVLSALSQPADAWELLLVARLIVGFSSGLFTVVAPMYLSEIAPVKWRGGIGVVNQLAVTLGIFISQILGLDNVLGNADNWPWLLGITAFPPLAQVIILFFCPRSPRYVYISLENAADARAGLYSLRGSDEEADMEIKEIEAEKQAESEPNMSLLDLLKSRTLWPALTIGIVMHLSQQLSGINAIFYYAVTFFIDAGIEKSDAKFANLGVGAIMVVMTLVTVPLMDRLGRRVLHLVGLAGMLIMAILIVIAASIESSGAQIFLIIVTLGFVVFFAVGPGSIPWMITGELFTQGPRGAASSICVLVNWSANLLVSLLFPNVLVLELKEYSFLPFAGCLLIFIVFVWLALPETKGKSVGETSKLVQDKKFMSGRKYT